MRLHKIRVEISSFLLNKHSVHNFRLLPVMFQVNQFDMFTEVYRTCILYTSVSIR